MEHFCPHSDQELLKHWVSKVSISRNLTWVDCLLKGSYSDVKILFIAVDTHSHLLLCLWLLHRAESLNTISPTLFDVDSEWELGFNNEMHLQKFARQKGARDQKPASVAGDKKFSIDKRWNMHSTA